MKQILLILTLFLFSLDGRTKQPLAQFLQKPQLVVLVVIDQFRSDYLTRFYGDFLPPQKGAQLGGFRYLMEKGAYFPFAQYGLFQAITCPGHSMILTGAYPSDTGIPLNDWYDRSSKKLVNCVADDGPLGASPRNLKTTTVGDEFRDINEKSRVVSIALKDRSAIMMGGQRPTQSLWMNDKTHQWVTSSYYGALPPWVDPLNREIREKQGGEYQWDSVQKKIKYSDDFVYASPFGLSRTTEMALAALKELRLGQIKNQTDFLLISYSSFDLAGHLFGLHSPEMRDMTKATDRELSTLLNQINGKVGLSKTLVVLTADHGVAPSVDALQQKGLRADRINYLDLFKGLYGHLDKIYGAPKKGPWFEAYRSFNFYSNESVLKEKGLKKEDVLKVAKDWMKSYPGIQNIFTQADLEGVLDGSPFGEEEFRHQFIESKSGDLLIMPEPFYYEKSKALATHMTAFTYDNRVPLIFLGKPFSAGVYEGETKIIDIAPTLSFVLNVVPPPMSKGRVLNEAIQK